MIKKVLSFISILAVLLLIACGDDTSEQTSEDNAKEIEQEQQQEQEEVAEEVAEEIEEEEPIDVKIDVNEELLFSNHKLTVEQVKVYEEEGKPLLDINIKWINQSFPDKTTFLRAMGMDVHQGDNLLTEITEAWQDKYSDVYFPNAVGGSSPVRLTYELIDTETPVKIVFVAREENDENKEVTIEIQ